jgi:hypothetical protein
VLGAGIQDMELQPEGASSRLQVFRYALCNKGAGRVDEKRNDVRRGYQLAQQFQPLRNKLRIYTPVTLPAGRARLATSPAAIGSVPTWNMIGIVAVAAFAASAAGVLPGAAITFT